MSRHPASEQGFTIVEVLVAAAVLMVGVLSLLSVLDTANATSTTIRARDVATNLARQVTEAARSVPYASLTPQTIETALQNHPGLGSTEAGTWTVDRHNIDFTVEASVCAVDDPSDGRGPHDTGVYCANSATAGTNDRNPDDYKRVTVDLTWKTHRRVERSHQVTVVNHPGSAGGPAVTELSIAPPASAKITSPTGAVAFTANTSGSATSVAFSVDGAPSATANGTGTQWNFNWPIADLVDGTHLVTAQAFDSQGLSGATRSVTVTLNRFAPAAPTGLAGGRNGSVVELEWLPNPERDIVGYRVFRAGLSGATLVCPLARKITCVDESPPEGVLSYFVVAGDLSPAGEHRDGEPSPSIEVSTSNMAPHPPGDLSASRAGDTTTLQWGASAAADLQHGSVAFYRVYRDGTGRDDREYRTGTANDLTFVDGRTDGTTHQYWVTAVNSNLAESAPVGPVTM